MMKEKAVNEQKYTEQLYIECLFSFNLGLCHS